MISTRNKWVVVLLPLFILSAANATPTVSNYSSNFVVSAVSPTSDVHVPIVADVINTTESGNSHLAEVAAEFLKPPAAFTGSQALPVGAKSLPAVPGALLMVLTGFLCVSLVKDRKVWLAALAGLLWLGQAGIQAVPQLALRLSHRNHIEQQFSAELTYPYYLENSNRLRSDTEGTQYIGLLHHLAGIPQDTLSFLSLSAIIPEQYSLNSLLNCLTLKIEQFTYFSPAFIFENLPRGPPKLT
ncbi:MAG: hypothetical protein ACYS6W_18235 [Planctomycetota bacterium]|jgi:hypothetical protein